MSLKTLLTTATVGAAMMVATAANAAPLLFNFVGANGSGSDFSFDIDSNPTPDPAYSFAFVGDITNATGSLSGDSQLYFYTDADGGALANFAGSVNLYGPQLFSGTTDAPQFSAGSFQLTNGDNSAAGTLTVTAAGSSSTGAVPEPATWAMMMLGFGMIGFGLRRRSKVTTSVRFA